MNASFPGIQKKRIILLHEAERAFNGWKCLGFALVGSLYYFYFAISLYF